MTTFITVQCATNLLSV